MKPTLISNELAAFLGKEVGTQMARTEVTREINAYIRANNLQDKDNGRKINADTKLTFAPQAHAGRRVDLLQPPEVHEPSLCQGSTNCRVKVSQHRLNIVSTRITKHNMNIFHAYYSITAARKHFKY